MKKVTLTMSVLVLSLATAWVAYARDDKLMLPINGALELKDADDKLDGSIKFFFGDQKTPQILKKLGNDMSNKKTNAFGKSSEKACNWAFLSALVAFEKKAKSLGANAVINIASYYNRNTMSSATEFECHAGNVIAGVVLKGDYATIADK